MEIKRDKNGKDMHKIYCKECGKPRWVSTPNWKQVHLCIECQYAKTRKYNSAYLKKWREIKRQKNIK